MLLLPHAFAPSFSKKFTFLEASTLNPANSTTPSFLSMNLGAANSQRRIFVAGSGGYSSTNGVLSSITIGGQSATIHIQNNSGNGFCFIASAIVQSGASGDIDMTFSKSVSFISVGLYSATNYGSSPYATASAVASASPYENATANLNLPANGFLIASANGTSPYNSFILWTGANQDFQSNGSSGSLYFSNASASVNPTSATTSASVEASCSGVGAGTSICVLSWI
jgi:hypothetical protein